MTGILLLASVPLACELSRWRVLPEGPLPRTESGPRAGGPDAGLAAQEISAWLEKVPVTGLASCVAAEGEVLWCSADGWADVAAGEPLTAESSMRLGSVSKPVTATLLGRLLEQGLLELDRPIGELAPELPEHLHPVTPRQLASHTAGIRHYRWRLGWPLHETWSRAPYESVTDSLSVFANDPLLFPPGSGFQYSTHGYVLLGAILERAGAATFAELLERELVAPLGLTATSLDGPTLRPGWARSYEVVAGRYRDALAVDNSRMWPGGGIRASARDLARLTSALPGGDLIRHDTLEQLLAPQMLPGGRANPQNYALGWRLARTREFLGGAESYRVAHHGGVSSGGSAFVALFPDHSFAVAVLTNTRTGSGELVELAFEIAEPFMARRLGL